MNYKINYKKRNPIEILIKKYNKKIYYLKSEISTLNENSKIYNNVKIIEKINDKISKYEDLISVYENILNDIEDIYEKYNIVLKNKDRGILKIIEGIFKTKKFS